MHSNGDVWRNKGMADWIKNLSSVFSRTTDESLVRERTESFKDRLDREKASLREQEARRFQNGGNTQTAGPDTDEAARQEDLRALRALLGWKLGIQTGDVVGNPSKVDGYWFGVRRYVKEKAGGYETCWTLHFFRQCPHCRFLFPTLELGDYAEALQAAQNMMDGKDAIVSRSTQKLAAYLNVLESGGADEYCPRLCPSCRKLIRGGTQ